MEEGNHLTGDPGYDADMDLVTSFIEAKLYPDDFLAQVAVHYYYVSRIAHYWRLTKAYVQDVPVSNRRNTLYRRPEDEPLMGSRNFTAEEVMAFETLILSRINALIVKFAKKKQIFLRDYMTLFEIIGSISCLQIPDLQTITERRELTREDDGVKVYFDDLYPLPNGSGIFGINTWLYAYFKDIQLVGVPLHDAFFDRFWGCPFSFILHDFDHIRRIAQISVRDKGLARQIYYRILSDTTLNVAQRLCLIFCHWISIHEVREGMDFHIPETNNIKEFFSRFYWPGFVRTVDDLGDEAVLEFKKFADFTQSPENLDGLRSMAVLQTEAGQPQEDDYSEEEDEDEDESQYDRANNTYWRWVEIYGPDHPDYKEFVRYNIDNAKDAVKSGVLPAFWYYWYYIWNTLKRGQDQAASSSTS